MTGYLLPSYWLKTGSSRMWRQRSLVTSCCLMVATASLLYCLHATALIRFSPAVSHRVAWLRMDGSEGETCTPRHNIAFLKTHKCASSAIQNILFRYGRSHDLQLAIPDYGNYYGGGRRDFQAYMYRSSPWAKLGVNIFAIHTKWNQSEMEMIMPNDTVYVSIVREPSQLFESMYIYTDMEKLHKMNVQQFVLNKPVTVPRDKGYLGYNQMTWDFGIPVEHINNITAVSRMVEEVGGKFSLVLVAERMEESLVLLAHLMCWPLSEVLVLKLNARSSKYKTKLGEQTLTILREKLAPDYLLYHHFLAKFEALVEEFGQDRMAREVARLRVLTQELMARCDFNRKPSVDMIGVYRPWSDKVEGYTTGNTTDEDCLWKSITEVSFLNFLRNKQHKELLARFGRLGLPVDPRQNAILMGAVPLGQAAQNEKQKIMIEALKRKLVNSGKKEKQGS